MSGLLLGVDGGGSKTAFALCDLSGTVLARAEGDTSNYNQVGPEGVEAALADGLAALGMTAGLALDDAIAGAIVGIGGIGEVASEMPNVAAAVASGLAGLPHRLVNDAEVGWAGAFALSPGVNVIAGTGSLAFGVDPAGNRARVGGWAWAVGDEGSAHWLARRILHIFTRQADRRVPRTALYEALRHRLKVRDDVEVRFLPLRAPRKDVAALCTILPEIDALGDPTAALLYREAAEELALHLVGMRAALRFGDDEIPVSGTGGVFKLDPSIRTAFAAALATHGGRPAAPRASPVDGALMMAAAEFAPASRDAVRRSLLGDHPFPLPLMDMSDHAV